MSKFCDVCNSPISLAESHSLIDCQRNQIKHLKEELEQLKTKPGIYEVTVKMLINGNCESDAKTNINNFLSDVMPNTFKVINVEINHDRTRWNDE